MVGKSCVGFSNSALSASIFVSVKSVAGIRPFGIAWYTSPPPRSTMQRNSKADIRPSLKVRETPIIEPPAAGVHRSSNVVVFDEPDQIPAIHATSDIEALALASAGRAVAGAA